MLLIFYRRALDHVLPLAFIISGALFGAYTFVHILLVERTPRLAFDFQHWNDKHLARSWGFLGPILAKMDSRVVPRVAAQAYGVVIDIG